MTSKESGFYGLEQWGIEQADRYALELFARFEEIARSPFRYPAVNDIREGYRRSVVDPDSIYYRISGSEVEIMAIIGNQELETWL